ncbi:IseA DL-endopeptidase inhibitor family protein [Bacillus infantis]|uniref:IseA DL-endopeptidase inhibitor family protein n=1 Tax=Bacillus infantis TaxID=324767 RepID=UPI003CF6F22C
MRKLKLIAILLGFLLLGGCTFLPEPVSLIQAPRPPAEKIQEKENLETVAKRFLPADAILAVPDRPVGGSSILEADFDGDGSPEAAVFYKLKGDPGKPGTLVLKKVQKEWTLQEDIKGIGFDVGWGAAADVTGDGADELLLGWSIGASAGSTLNIFSFAEGSLKKIGQENYHELEMVRPEEGSFYSLAVWARDLADVYQVDMLSWDGSRFTSDKELYPAYFPKVSQYYKARTAEVPDAAIYWYFLAEAQVKEGKPEEAIQSIEKGMNLNMIMPGYSKFSELKDEIIAMLGDRKGQDTALYIPESDLTLAIPLELFPYLTVEGSPGTSNEYSLSASIKPEGEEKGQLFDIVIYPKDAGEPMDEKDLLKLFEDDLYIYMVRKGWKNPYPTDSPAFELYSLAVSKKDEIISSLKRGSPVQKLENLEEEMLAAAINEAAQKRWHVQSGGNIEEMESITIDDLDYRFMGRDLDSESKLIQYFSSSFTNEAISAYITHSGIKEHNGRLVQPNADGGSIMGYQHAEILQMKDAGDVKEFDLKAPLGDTLLYETFHIEFEKTKAGWKISSMPGSF